MGILVADRKFLGEIGALDEGMKVYGGENVELGIRVSQPRLTAGDLKEKLHALSISCLFRRTYQAHGVESQRSIYAIGKP